MPKDIDIEYDNETEEYILLLDDEKQGPVDEDSLRELASDLHMSFTVFRDVE